MADRIREIQSKLLKNLHGGDQLAAAIAYVPLFGWIFPLYFRKEDDFCQFHGKQGMRLNLVMFALYFVIWVIENFPLTAWLFGGDAWLNVIPSFIWRIAEIAYLGLCVLGAIKALSDEKWEIPYLTEYVEKALDQILKRKA